MKKYLLVFTLILSQIFSAQQDCVTAIPICSNADISLTPGGWGDVHEGEVGCLTPSPGSTLQGESNSIWLTFSIQTAGTLTFVITPTGPNANDIDYDWALYGPNHDCANLTADPLRCSYAGPSSAFFPLTGLNMTSTDTSETASGDGFVKYIDVVPGQIYHLLLNNFSTTIAPFTLSFGGTATLLTPFGDPVLQPYPFVVPGPNHDGNIDICGNPAVFDFSTLNNEIINGNPNFVVKYYTSATDAFDGINPILSPIPVNATDTYHYVISYEDPANPINFLNKCKEYGTIKFIDRSFIVTDDTLTECSNNNSGTATYNLTDANIGLVAGQTAKYYRSMTDLNAGSNEITNPYVYSSAEGKVYVKVSNEYECVDIAEITLKFYPIVEVLEATLRSCFIEANPSTGLFNLINAVVTTQTGATKKYYPSQADAVNQTNEIPPTTAASYTAPNGVVYVRVMNDDGCYTVAKINLIVIPPVYSTVLVDKVICPEDKTTLDAGSGFDSYEWSTGATTQSITSVGTGTYWVKLKTGDCVAKQEVKVFASEQPVVANIEISNNNITVYVIGGTPAYQYSIDDVNWQDSNMFTNMTRGDHTIYVKDSYNCNPIEVGVVVPNIINVITPNGDGVNDVVDYSALAGKENLILSIFDRYGAKIFQADKSNGYKWDGSANGSKKVPTGNYWYSVTWNENNKNKTPIKFSGWILVKNRE